MFSVEKRERDSSQGFPPNQPYYVSIQGSAKVIFERLKQVMDAIISPTQSVFIEGMQILDQILIANEAIEDYRAKRKKVGF